MQASLIEHGRIGAATAVPGDPSVLVRGLCKAFHGRSVLRDIDLTIAPGEFVAVVGRSGCGKSTLLRLVAGLDTPDRGYVAHGNARRRPVTRIMFQDSRLLPWKRVLANVALGLPRSVKDRAGSALVLGREALRQVGLEERADEWPAVLSGGQRQRVALARALVHAPQLLLLDEPLGALDALTRIEMQQLIETLWLQRRFSALLVTHDVQEAVALADRVVLIEDGRIALDETVALARPRSRADAGFVRLEQRILARVLGRAEGGAAQFAARAEAQGGVR